MREQLLGTIDTASMSQEQAVDHLIDSQKAWNEVNYRNGALPMQPNSTVEGMIDASCTARSFDMDHLQRLQTSHFIRSLLIRSSMPPINPSGLVDQIVASQSTGGEIPLVLEEIACLSYGFTSPREGSRGDIFIHTITNNQPKKRWAQFIDEQKDMLIGLTEIGVKPLVLFGISDRVVDTDHATQARLQPGVTQNTETMRTGIEQLHAEFQSASLPNNNLRPSLKVFTHTEVLTGANGELMDKNLDYLTRNRDTLFRLWETISSTYNPNTSSQSEEIREIEFNKFTLMIGLYMTDRQLGQKLASELFEKNVPQVTILSLQPQQPTEWIAERIAQLLASEYQPIPQIAPLANAGRWHAKPSQSAPFSVRRQWKLPLTASTTAFRTLTKLPDAELLREDEEGDKKNIMTEKEQRALQILSITYGQDFANMSEAAYRNRRSKSSE